MLGKRPTYQAALTQADADAIVNDYPLPDGWLLFASAIRSFESRSEWLLALYHGTTLERGWRVYDLRGACLSMQAHAERESRVTA